MWIAVCDDENNENISLIERINEYAIQFDYDIHCRAFTSGKELLRCDQVFDMYFLDFQMDGMDGMELAERLRKDKKVEAYIVFLTAYMHFVQEAFKVNTHRFLHKPVTTEALYEALDSLMLPTIFSRHITLKRTTQEDCIFTNDIISVEAQGKNTKVTMQDRTQVYRHLLKDVEEMLPNQLFFKVHRSCIVNMEFIRSYSNRDRTIQLKTGDSVDISRDRLDEFSLAYNRFVSRFK